MNQTEVEWVLVAGRWEQTRYGVAVARWRRIRKYLIAVWVVVATHLAVNVWVMVHYEAPLIVALGFTLFTAIPALVLTITERRYLAQIRVEWAGAPRG